MEDTRTEDLPETAQFEINGHTVTVNYRRDYTLMARICFLPALLRELEAIMMLANDVVDPSVSSWNYYYVVVDDAGNELVSSPGGYALQYEYEQHVRREQQDQNYETLKAELDELSRTARALRGRDLPTSEINAAINAADTAIQNLYGYWKATTYSQAKAALARVRRLIAELEGSFVAVVVRNLMNRTIWRSDTGYNESIRRRQLVLWIRLGGDEPLVEHLGEAAIDLLTDDRLAQIYAERLQAAGVTNLTEVDKVELTLDSEEFVPEWLLGVPELHPAPEFLVLETPKGVVTPKVSYSLRPEGDELVPVGTARLKLSDYDKSSSTLSLPHGIELVLELTVNDIVVVRGPVGEVLTKRIKAYKGGRRRGNNAPPSDLVRTSPVLAGEAPPWLATRRGVRWR